MAETDKHKRAKPEPLVDVKTAAKMLGLSEKYVAELARKSELPSILVGRAVRFYPSSLNRWRAERHGLDGTLSAGDVAALLAVKPDTVRALATSGELRGSKIETNVGGGARERWSFRVEDVEAFIAAHTREAE